MTRRNAARRRKGEERLIFVPLGGAGEIGMNCYVYGWGRPGEERLIVVDLGVAFPDMDTSPGVDLIMADVEWLVANVDRIGAIFITHAHEDHVGAVGLLWDRLRAPIHARRFTATHAGMKLEARGQDPGLVNVVEPWPEQVKAGPFRVGFLPVSHSIPESSALVIDTPVGRVIHTGDFKLDPTPVVGEAWDPGLWRSVAGEEGIHALVCDSTNVFSEHPGRSEISIRNNITELFAGAKGLVGATTFASNVARLRTLAEAGIAAGRSVVLLGRAMNTMVQVARSTGIISDFPSLVAPEDARDIPRERLLLLATGSQGERRAATSQLSEGKYHGFSLREGDMFLFSSKTIPGNEKAVFRVMNNMSRLGVEVIDEHHGDYHVSGHANQPDLIFVQDMMRPRMVIPMHGEHRHLRKLAALSEERGRPSVVATDGQMVDITGTTPRIIGEVPAGRTYLDGAMLIGAMDGVVLERLRAARNGVVTISVLVDDAVDEVTDIFAEIRGLPEKNAQGRDLPELVEEAVRRELSQLGRKALRNDERVEEHVKRAARKTVLAEVGKKAEVGVMLTRLED